MIPGVREELGCYHQFYISLHFIKEDGLDKRQDQVGINTYPNEEDIKDVVINDQREIHWCMVFLDNNGGVDGTKALLHDKKWGIYNLDKQALLKGGYLVGFYDNYGKKVILEVVDKHVVEQGVEHQELGIRGFDFNLFDEDMEVYVKGDVKELPYLLMLVKLWHGYLKEQIYRINKNLDKDNGRGGNQDNGRFQKLWRL